MTDRWYCTGQLSEVDTLGELAWVGGTPWEELDLEDGLEAPPRPSLRSAAQVPTERDESTIPDPWLLVPEAERLAEEGRVRKAEEAANRDHERAVARYKSRLSRERAFGDLKAWRAEMHAKYPHDPRWA